MSGSFASEQTVEGDAETDDQQHAGSHREQPLPPNGLGELCFDTVMSELNFAVAGLDRYALLDLTGPGMFGAVEMRPADLAGIEQDHVVPGLLPLRRVAFEASGHQVRLAAESKCHRQRDVMPAASGRIAMDREGE